MTRPWRQLKQAVKVKIKKTFHLILILWEILPNNIRFFSLPVRDQLKYSDLLVLLCRLPRRVYYLCSQHDTFTAALQSLRRELYRNISQLTAQFQVDKSSSCCLSGVTMWLEWVEMKCFEMLQETIFIINWVSASFYCWLANIGQTWAWPLRPRENVDKKSGSKHSSGPRSSILMTWWRDL